MPNPSSEYNLAVKHPDLVKEWHPTKNGARTPQRVSPTSRKWVWWKCSKKCGHEWETRVHSRANGMGCPKCFYLKRASHEHVS